MILTINSKILGKKITFSRPASSYIFVDLNGKSGILGNQICEYGCLMGDTIAYRGYDQKEFNRICRNWYKSFIRKEKRWLA